MSGLKSKFQYFSRTNISIKPPWITDGEETPFVSRFCGRKGLDDSCDAARLHYKGSTCVTCDEDFCNGALSFKASRWSFFVVVVSGILMSCSTELFIN